VPKSPKKKSKRQIILDAARGAFIEAGYAGTSMDQISERAGVSKRTVYNHFGSKDGLFETAVLEFHGAQLNEGVAELDRSAPIRDQLIGVASARLGGLLRPDTLAFLRMLIGEFMRSPELARDLGARLKDPEHDPLIPLIRDAGAKSGMVDQDVERMVEHFWSLMLGHIFWPQVVMHEEQSAVEVERRVVDAVDLFLAAYPDMR